MAAERYGSHFKSIIFILKIVALALILKLLFCECQRTSLIKRSISVQVMVCRRQEPMLTTIYVTIKRQTVTSFLISGIPLTSTKHSKLLRWDNRASVQRYQSTWPRTRVITVDYNAPQLAQSSGINTINRWYNQSNAEQNKAKDMQHVFKICVVVYWFVSYRWSVISPWLWSLWWLKGRCVCYAKCYNFLALYSVNISHLDYLLSWFKYPEIPFR